MPDHRQTANTSGQHQRHAGWPATLSLILVIAIGVAATLVSHAGGHSVAGFAQETDSTGASRNDPVPLGQAAIAGPLRITVSDVSSGPAAVERVLAASPNNPAPRQDHTFVLAHVTVGNEGETPVFVSNDDFGLTGSSGIVHRFLIAEPPAPALFATIDPGASAEGWLIFEAPTAETEPLLVFDSPSFPGTWARQTLTLLAGTSIPDATTPAAARNEAGLTAAAPAELNTAIVTGTWQVELIDVAVGADVFALVDYRTGALGIEDSNNDSPWLALQVRVTNIGTGGDPSYFPANAFALADATGAQLLDFVTLTPPVPDASGAYYPGASREGWVAFELPNYDPYLIIFDPYDVTTETPDPRYLTYQ
ncbi:MAG: DUF4352 domain-containing protein [Chloroflexota bacterium]|nr:DUF4352 domain-containing protein [Chloroflexota bacterium]